MIILSLILLKTTISTLKEGQLQIQIFVLSSNLKEINKENNKTDKQAKTKKI